MALAALTGTGLGAGGAPPAAAAGGDLLWEAHYDGPRPGSEDVARQVAVSPDGTRVFVTGWSDGLGTDYDYGTLALDASTGRELWLARYDAARDRDLAQALAVSPDGTRVFVTGRSRAVRTDSYDMTTLAYDTETGQELWVARYATPAADEGLSVAVSPDGSRVVVAGRGHALFPTVIRAEADAVTVAYDAASGRQLWAAAYDGPAHGGDEAIRVAVDPQGSRVFVTGTSAGIECEDDYVTLAYELSTGRKLWEARQSGPGCTEEARDLALSPDGALVFVTGWADMAHASLRDILTVAYDAATGRQLWQALFDGPGNAADEPWRLAVSSRAVFVTGWTYKSRTNNFDADFATLAYDPATGQKLWQAFYDGPGGDIRYGYDFALAAAVAPDGSRLFVAGYSVGSFSLDFATVAYEAATGAMLWEARYNGYGHSADVPWSLAVSPDGSRLFVAGESAPPVLFYGTDYAVLAYDAAPASCGTRGSLSRDVHRRVEPEAAPLSPAVHQADCTMAAAGL